MILTGLGAGGWSGGRPGGLSIAPPLPSSGPATSSTGAPTVSFGRRTIFGRVPGTFRLPVSSPLAIVQDNPNVTDRQRFLKGQYLRVPGTRVDVATGESGYDPSKPLDRMRLQVQEAATALAAKYGDSSGPIKPITSPLTQEGAGPAPGGGGGGGGGGGDTADDIAKLSWWAKLSMPAKVGIIGGAGLAGVYVVYRLMKKRGGGAGHRSKSGR